MIRTKDLFMQMQEDFVNTCNDVENGNISVLDAVIHFRRQKEVHEQMLENIKAFEAENIEQIEQEASYNQNQYKGAKFEFRGGGKSFNFKNIQEWEYAKDNLKEIEEKYKAVYLNKEKGLATYDETTGEELPIPEVIFRKSSLIVKLEK